MTKTYRQVRAQIEALQAEADKLRAGEKSQVLKQVKDLVAQFDLSPQEVFGRAAAKGPARKGGAREATSAKYRDGQGNEWGGRGPRPRWVKEAIAAGHDLTDFLVGAKAAKRPGASVGSRTKGSAAAKKRGGAKPGRKPGRPPKAAGTAPSEASGAAGA